MPTKYTGTLRRIAEGKIGSYSLVALRGLKADGLIQDQDGKTVLTERGREQFKRFEAARERALLERETR